MTRAVRTKQSKPVARTAPIIYLHGRFHDGAGLAHVVLSINGQRWEYYLTTYQADTVEYLCKHISARKALAFARSRSTRQVKL